MTAARPPKTSVRTRLIVAISLLTMLAWSTPITAAVQTDAEAVARAFIRLAGDITRPAPDAASEIQVHRLELAQILLEQAATLDPQNAETQRRLALIAAALGDDEGREAAARRILALDPRDGLVQLDRVSTGLSRLQTVESRLKVMNRFVRTKASDLDPGVRSRMIFEAAILAEESGDPDGALERLKAAQQLDPTNLDAAALLALAADTAGEPTRVVMSAMLRLVRADPFQIMSLTDLAGVLLEIGAYDLSNRACEIARTLVVSRRNPVSNDLATQHLLASSAATSFGDGLTALGSMFPTEAYPTGNPAYRQMMIAHHVIAAMVESVDHSTQAWNGLNAIWSPQLENEDSQTDGVRFERVWLATLTDHAYADRESDFELLRANARDWTREDPRLLAWRRVEGWLAYHEDALDAATAILEPLAESDPWADLGLARCLRDKGLIEAATRRLTAIHQRVPGTLVGVLAKRDLEGILNRALPSLGLDDDFDPMVARDLGVIEAMIARPSTALTMRIEPATIEVAPLSPLIVNLEFRNTSRWAIPIRRDSLLPPSVVIVPQVIVGGQHVPVPGGAIVVNIHRRFFLSPGETMRISLDLSETVLGTTMDQHPWLRGSLRYRAFLGFLIGTDGRLYPGPLALSHESQLVRRQPWPFTEAFGTQTSQTLTDLGSSKQRDAIAVVGALEFLRQRPDGQTLLPVLPWVSDCINTGAEIIATSWQDRSDLLKTWAVLQIPPAVDASPSALRDFESQAANTRNRTTRLAWLLTRVSDSDDPVLLAMLSDEGTDDDVRRAAEAMHAILESRGQ